MNYLGIKRFRSERGEGAGTIIFFILVLGVIWLVANFVIGYIYDKKEERTEPKRTRKGKIVATTFIPREAGSYSVEYDK
jgi:hypothetical protein